MVSSDHTVEHDLNNDQEVLMSEEQQILQTGVNRELSSSVHFWGGMGEQVEKLDKASDRYGFEFLCAEEGLTEVDILDDLQSYQLRWVHCDTTRCGLGQLPPVFTKESSVLVSLETLYKT